jgi:Ca2+-binding RTX toxin-like protein
LNRYSVVDLSDLTPGDVIDGSNENGRDELWLGGNYVYDLTPIGIPSQFIDIEGISISDNTKVILSLSDLMEGSRFASDLDIQFWGYTGGSTPAITILMDDFVNADLSSMGWRGSLGFHVPDFSSGSVLIEGSGADNSIISTSTNDQVFGYGGADSLRGSYGHDILKGGKGNDTLDGGPNRDTLYGQNGDDLLIGDSNKIFWWSRPEEGDSLFGGRGNDTLEGGAENDTLRGAWGDDLLLGGHHNDKLFGNLGNDTLLANTGQDTLWGGQGADTFRFHTGDGENTIYDFKLGLDSLELETGLWVGTFDQTDLDGMATVHAGGFWFDFLDGTSIDLLGLTDITGLIDDIVLI